jgi:hypothetical protein
MFWKKSVPDGESDYASSSLVKVVCEGNCKLRFVRQTA